MTRFSNKNNKANLIATIIFVFAIAAAVTVIILLDPIGRDKDEYSWITSDPAAEDGMLDGSFYNGKKNEAGILSYKIAESITIESDGIGNIMAENSGKNNYIMKLKIVVGDETIYETGYLKPNQHIKSDKFDVIPEVGTYEAKAVFEGFDPTTETSVGTTGREITVTVIK